MISSIFKKLTSHARMRQFTTLVVCNRNQVQTRIHHWKGTKYSCLVNPKPSPCRWYCSGSQERRGISLPPLLDGPIRLPSLFFLLSYRFYIMFKINNQVDPSFDLAEYLSGTKKAISLISNALANRDYEALNGLVVDEMIEKLRNGVDRLTDEQRRIVAVKEDDLCPYIPMSVDVTCVSEDPVENIVEISYVYYYSQFPSEVEDSVFDTIQNIIEDENSKIICNYSFQRRYVNNEGGPWIATVVNHFTGGGVAKTMM